MLDLSIKESETVSFEFVEDIFNKLENNLSIKNTKRNIIKSKHIKFHSISYTTKNVFKNKLKSLLKAKNVSNFI